MDHYSTPKNQRNEDVTGVSRSGRVRKKPSKLSDFESPDDITEQRIKRQKAQQHAHAQQLLQQFEEKIHQQDQLKNSMLYSNYTEQPKTVEKIIVKQLKPHEQKNAQQSKTPLHIVHKIKIAVNQPVNQIKPAQQINNTHQIKPQQRTSIPAKQTNAFQHAKQPPTPAKQEIKNPVLSEESSQSETENINGISENVNDEESSMESSSDDDDEDEDDDEEISTAEEEETEIESTGFTKLEPPGIDDIPSKAKNSLYMQEKYKKKIVIQDGKVINKTIKTQRKDKGKTRFTAYMLWAKEARQHITDHYPNLDFTTTSKKLGELWASVPNLEKYNWRKRAKRMAMRSVSGNKDTKVPPPTFRTFINKTTAKKEPSPVKKKPSPVKKQPSPVKKQPFVVRKESSPVKTVIELEKPTIGTKVPESPPSQKAVKDLNEAYLGTGIYKVTGTQPIDVAAHLTLLGESLTVIGKRLKEHEGQITISGSLPLLLDSLLCAVSPLLCLTQQIPEMNGADPDVLSSTLENVAYIMPGL